MTDMESVTQLPDDFDGHVRLFPLPDLVVFPHAMQPLNIFEPRYCDLLAESLASDRLITMSTYHPRAPGAAGDPSKIEPIVCISRIISHTPTDDNRHNVLLLGAKRARILREYETQRSFRMAEVEIIEDVYPPTGASKRQPLRDRVLQAFRNLIPAAGGVHANLHELMASQMPLGAITDIIAYTLAFDVRKKIELLELGDVDRRADVLANLLEELATKENHPTNPPPSSFPPPFSDN